MTIELRLERIASPLGEILVVRDGDDCLRALDFADFADRMHRLLRRQVGPVALTERPVSGPLRDAVEAWFAGETAALERWPVRLGGTAFQRLAWQALQAIPAGSTATYAMQAARIGRPTAARAVGMANGANPVAIRVPCHRVIGANGALTGYGGGLWRKEWLLAHEAKMAAPR